MKTLTKTAKVEKALRKSTLTATQISSRFDVPNVRAMLYDLKRKGLNVIRNENNKGTVRYAIAN